MALDHYVPQVHLKAFYSPALGELMYAVNKNTGKAFRTNSRSACRIEDGNTNAYLKHDRAIEEFLKTIEPNYNAAVRSIFENEITPQTIYVIAGFLAAVMACSPTGIRLNTGPAKAILDSTARAIDSTGGFPQVPDSLGGKTLTELMASGKINIRVDPRYSQAIAISNALSMTAAFGNFKWEILHNDYRESPFFTSDFPVALEETENPLIVDRVVPLTPHLAVRIRPDISLASEKLDFSFRHFGYRSSRIARTEVRAINRLLVQCAERLIFYPGDLPWVRPFIGKYGRYRLETEITELPAADGTFVLSTQKIVERE